MPVEMPILYRILREIAVNRGSPIRYGELSQRYLTITGDDVNAHFGWSAPLLAILEWCSSRGLPPLSALVISDPDGGDERFRGLPSGGFWGQAGTPPAPSLEAWIEMCNAIYRATWPAEFA